MRPSLLPLTRQEFSMHTAYIIIQTTGEGEQMRECESSKTKIDSILKRSTFSSQGIVYSTVEVFSCTLFEHAMLTQLDFIKEDMGLRGG